MRRSALVLATSLAACSSTGGRKAVEEASNNAGHANTPTMTVALVTHSGPGDTFWDIVRKGAEDAAAKDNIELRYSSDPQAPNQANLVQSAIDAGVDGIATRMLSSAHSCRKRSMRAEEWSGPWPS